MSDTWYPARGGDMRLTRNFRLGEFAVSREHPELAAQVGFSEREIGRLQVYCAGWLQPLRDHFDAPVIITSGKRTAELNAAVGGVEVSDHLYGGDSGAVDLVVQGLPLDQVYVRLLWTPYKLLILYRWPSLPERNFIHLSFPDALGIAPRTTVHNMEERV